MKEINQLFISDENQHEARIRAQKLPSLEVSQIDLQWIQVLSEGWATPLYGFMREKEYLQCLFFGSLINENVHNQSIPIVLPVSDEDNNRLQHEKSITLTYNNNIIAILDDIELYEHRKEERCARIFGTTNTGHPTIKLIMESGDWLVGGDLKVFQRITWNDGLDEYRLTPTEIRKKLKQMRVSRSFNH